MPPAAAFLAPLVADLACPGAFELDARLRRALRLEQRQMARLGPLLLAVASERLYCDLGYRGLDAYARERLGMAPSKARALLRLERIAQRAAVFGEAWRGGRISWTQAEALAPLLRLDAARCWRRCSATSSAPRGGHRARKRPSRPCSTMRSSYRNLHDHPIVFRSVGGSDDLANRTTLCVWHHLRAIHAGLARCLGQAPGRLRFALGLRPGRPPLVSYASGDFVLGGAVAEASGGLAIAG